MTAVFLTPQNDRKERFQTVEGKMFPHFCNVSLRILPRKNHGRRIWKYGDELVWDR